MIRWFRDSFRLRESQENIISQGTWRVYKYAIDGGILNLIYFLLKGAATYITTLFEILAIQAVKVKLGCL